MTSNKLPQANPSYYSTHTHYCSPLATLFQLYTKKFQWQNYSNQCPSQILTLQVWYCVSYMGCNADPQNSWGECPKNVGFPAHVWFWSYIWQKAFFWKKFCRGYSSTPPHPLTHTDPLSSCYKQNLSIQWKPDANSLTTDHRYFLLKSELAKKWKVEKNTLAPEHFFYAFHTSTLILHWCVLNVNDINAIDATFIRVHLPVFWRILTITVSSFVQSLDDQHDGLS